MRNIDSNKINRIVKYVIAAMLITGISVAIYFVINMIMSYM